jgi:mono/diheme cytochrome c family protein
MDGCFVFAFLRFLAIILFLTAPFAANAADDLASKAYVIIQMRCLECHGPEKKRGGLRLDSLEGILAGGESTQPAIIRSNAENSLLIDKITSEDPKERMPSKADPLPAAEIETLRAWIDAGAPWPKNAAPVADAASRWAFVPPVRPAVPQAKRPDAVRNDIDRFLDAALDHAGLAPAPEADKYTLVRRAHLELIGLPPTPDEIRAFVKDRRPDAFERLVDALLASPHYGERQARRWLDAVRYADTNGYEKDRPRSIWPYRDWVIRAFNDNMRFDDFAIEQIAGDLLPNATESQKVATGFHRNSMFNEEGGIDSAEDWYKRTVDRANTTATVFLGLTVGCAQCHDHKFDPISQREYYQFAAFINDSGEATLPLRDARIEAQRAAALALVRGEEEWILWLARRDPAVRAEFEDWAARTRALASEWRVLRPIKMDSRQGATLKQLDDGSVLATGDIPNRDFYSVELDPGAEPITAIRLEVLPDDSLPGRGPGRGVILAEGDFLLTGIHASLVSGAKETPLTFAAASQDYAAKDNEAALALDDRSDTGWSVKGATGKQHAAVFAFARAIKPGRSRLRLGLDDDYIHQQTIGRFRISVTSRPAPVAASGVPAEVESALLKAPDSRTLEERSRIERHYALEIAPRLERWRKKLDSMRTALPEFPTSLVMTSREAPRPTFIRHRGEFLNPTDEVSPGVPAVLPPLPEGAPMNRLTLAKWIVSERNPLTARVTMNRLWEQVFGRGLVATVDDFGTRGDRPTHPELLDWLATEFMRSGWDYKAMHRLLVTSAAFRRSPNVTPEVLEKDPDNQWLARGPRVRLEAEIIRDTALAAAGLLDPRIGGPSVYPPQPEGVSELAYDGAHWPTSAGPDRYRRGLYTYMKRTTPYAAAVTFDAPSGEEVCTRRARTTTPLQALVLLNDQVYLEAAQAMARRVLDRGGTTDARIAFACLLCLGRPPDAAEKARIADFFAATRSALQRDPARASEVAGPIGLAKPKRVPELAAWTAVCRAILNLDETITRG